MFVRRCLICNALLDPNEKYLCSNCLKKIEGEYYDNYLIRCPKCYHFMIAKEIECEHCKNKDFKIFSFCSYESYTRYILFGLKFKSQKKYAPLIALLYSRQLQKIVNNQKVALVPIPCSKIGLKKRGFDHMKLVCSFLGENVYDVLIRKDKNEQKRLNKQQRCEKNKEKFSINLKELNKINEKVIFLVDDIYTTGTTMKIAYQLISSYSEKEIRGVTWFSRFNI